MFFMTLGLDYTRGPSMLSGAHYCVEINKNKNILVLKLKIKKKKNII